MEELILAGEFKPTTYELIEDTTDSIHMILTWDRTEYPTAPIGLQKSVDFSAWDIETENRTLVARVQAYLEGLPVIREL
jgi:hypothetical protein